MSLQGKFSAWSSNLFGQCPTLAAMEMVCRDNQQAEVWVIKVGQALFCLFAVISLLLWGVLLFDCPAVIKEEIERPAVSILTLGQGTLALTPPQAEGLQPILKELVLIGTNTRPDRDRICSLALRSSGEKRATPMGEAVFFKAKDGKIEFSKDKTDLSFTPLSLEGGMLLCEVKSGEASEICSLPSSAIFSCNLSQEPYFETLKNGAVWGRDVFLSGWGGEEYREMVSKTKISLGADVFFLKPGECLWWDGQMWVSELGSDEVGAVAQLVKGSSQGADFQVWDPTGLSSQMVHVGIQTSPKKPLKLDELMTAVRARSPSEITCQLGKRRVIIREGDWWIRSDDRWKPVRTAADLEACLLHQIPGELFIFEKVETSKGKVTLHGRSFDRMRTVAEPMSLVLHTEKKPAGIHKPPTGSSSLAKSQSRLPVVSHRPEGL